MNNSEDSIRADIANRLEGKTFFEKLSLIESAKRELNRHERILLEDVYERVQKLADLHSKGVDDE
jgi:hypothetical protein